MLKRLTYIATILLCLTACHGTAERVVPMHQYNESELSKQRLAELVKSVYEEVHTMSAVDIILFLSQGARLTNDGDSVYLDVNLAGLSVRGSVSKAILAGKDAPNEGDFSLGVYENDKRLALIGLELLPYGEQEIWLPTPVFRFDDGTSCSWNSLLIDFYE